MFIISSRYKEQKRWTPADTITRLRSLLLRRYHQCPRSCIAWAGSFRPSYA